MEENDEFNVEELNQYISEEPEEEKEEFTYAYDSVKEFDYDEDEDDFDDDDEDGYDDFELFPDNKALNRSRKIYKGLDTGKELYKKYVAQGHNPIVIAGMLGNSYAESKFDPNADGDGGTSYGLFQHHNDRKTELLNYIKNDKSNKSLSEKQIDFAIKDLKNKYPQVYSKMLKARTPGEAAAIFQKGYEKPKHIDPQRSIYADDIARQIGGISDDMYNRVGPNPFVEDYTIKMPAYNYSTAFNKSAINYTPVGEPFVVKPVWEDKVMQENVEEVDPNKNMDRLDAAANLIEGASGLLNKGREVSNIVSSAASNAITGVSAFMNQRADKQLQNDLLRKLYQESQNDYI